MHFYTSVIQRGNKLLTRGILDGEPYKESIWYQPYLFLEDKTGKGEYRSIDGRVLAKKHFDSIYDAKDFVKSMQGVQGFKFWGMDQFVYPYINDTFEHGFEYDDRLVCVANIDIEVDSQDGFPEPLVADKPVTAITMIRDGDIHAFAYVDFPSAQNDPRIIFHRCQDEKELLQRFLHEWIKKYPDVITGWNVEGFDVPYIVTRLKRVLGENMTKLLSPWKILDEKTIEFRGREITTYTPLGITILDYLPIYRGKKFVMEPRESYTLNYIAHVELGEKKIDYSEYAGLWELWRKDPDKFMRYNVHDTLLVERLEEKLGLLSIIYRMSYGARINFTDALGSVKQWEVIIYGKMMRDKVVIDGQQNPDGFSSVPLVGGYVKNPMTDGFQEWPVSLDLDSLYSHLIMQYNISPETKTGKLDVPLNFEEILNRGLDEYRDEFKDNVVAANLVTYRKDKRGFLPTILEEMYNERKLFKSKALKAKQHHKDIVGELKKRGLTEEQLKEAGVINRV